MVLGGFSALRPLYIASGVLTYEDTEGMFTRQVEYAPHMAPALFLQASLYNVGIVNVMAHLGSEAGSSFHYKEMYLHKTMLSGTKAQLLANTYSTKCCKATPFALPNIAMVTSLFKAPVAVYPWRNSGRNQYTVAAFSSCRRSIAQG